MKEEQQAVLTDGYRVALPYVGGFNRMRPIGSVDGGIAVWVESPTKYRRFNGSELFDLPEGYEYKLIEASPEGPTYGGSA